MENIIRHTAKRANFILYLVIALAITGTYVYRNTPIEQFPDVDIPIVRVSTTYYQASPDDIATSIIEPLSEELQLIKKLDRSYSHAYQGFGDIILFFDVDADSDKKLTEVRNTIANVNLPSDAEAKAAKLDIGREALVVAITNDENRKLYQKEVRKIKRALLDIEGVSEVSVIGKRRDAIVISADPQTMNRANVEPYQIRNAVAMQKDTFPVGTIDNPGGTIILNLEKAVKGPEDFKDVVLFGGIGGRKILLSDVADVFIEDLDQSETRIDDQRGNIIVISVEAGVDMEIVADEAMATLNRLGDKMGLDITVLKDSYEVVKGQVDAVVSTLLSALFMIVIFGTLILGIIDGLLVGATIPLSFIISILVLNVFGQTINFPVLFGVLFAAGMIVDSSIVIIEWGVVKIRKGVSYTSAFYEAAIDMIAPILVSVFTTFAAFLPLFFMPGVFGKLMRPVPLTAATILASSLLVSFLFIPALGRYFHEVRRYIVPPASIRGQYFISLYSKLVAKLASKFWSTFVAGCLLLLFLGGSFFIFLTFGKTPYFMNNVDSDVLEIEVNSIEAMSSEEELAILKEVKDKIHNLIGDEVLHYRTSNSSLASSSSDYLTNIGVIHLYLKSWEERRPAQKISRELESYFATNSGEDNLEFIVSSQDTAPVKLDKWVEINLYTDLNEEPEESAAAFIAFLRNEPSIEHFQTAGPPEILRYNLQPYYNELSYHTITPLNLSEYAMLFTNGLEIGQQLVEGEEIPIVIRVPNEMQTISEFQDLKLLSKAGASALLVVGGRRGASGEVPLLSLASESFDKTRLYIFYQDGRASKNFRILPKDGQEKEFFDAIIPWVTGDHDLDGSFEFAGTVKEKNKMQAWLSKSFIFTILLILSILMLLFNSLYQSLIILSAVVFSVAGVALGLTVLGLPPGVMMTGMGIVFLAGIVVNNNIILIDHYNKLLKYNKNILSIADPIKRKISAIGIACGDRCRPIIFTSVTTIIGVMPAALGVSINIFALEIGTGDPGIVWYQDLSIAIVLGLFTATFITLLGTPMLVALGAHIEQKLSTLWNRLPKPNRKRKHS